MNFFNYVNPTEKYFPGPKLEKQFKRKKCINEEGWYLEEGEEYTAESS